MEGEGAAVLSEELTIGSARGKPRSNTQCRQHGAVIFSHASAYAALPLDMDAGVVASWAKRIQSVEGRTHRARCLDQHKVQ